jgi:hypothetical protein
MKKDWWLKNAFSTGYMIREGTSIFVSIYAVVLMWGLMRLVQGQEAFNGWLESLIQGGDYSRWGAINAITAQAHKTADVDRQVELETLGGRIMTLPASDWRRIAEAA